MAASKRGGVSILAILLATVFLTAAPASAAATLKLRMATSWDKGIPLYKDMAAVFAEDVEAMSGGRIKIQLLTGGSVVPALEVPDAVRKGIVQMGHTWVGYDLGKDPVSNLFGGYTGGMESVPFIHWIYAGGGKELWSKWRMEKFGVVGMPCGIRPPEVFLHSHKPVRTLDDFKGLKVRASGSWGEIIPKLGASVVMLPGGEVFQALERHVIDATEWASPGENVASGLHEIAKYVIVPGAHQPATPFELVVNKQTWEELPDDLKAIIEHAAELATFKSWYRIGRLDMGALDAFKKAGNEIIYLSPETQTRCHQLGKEWAEALAAKDPFFKEVFDSQNAFEKAWDKVSSIRHYQYQEK